MEKELFDEILLKSPKTLLPLMKKIVRTVEGEEVTDSMMALANVLVMLLQIYGLNSMDVLGMADLMTYPDSKTFFIEPEFMELELQLASH